MRWLNHEGFGRAYDLKDDARRAGDPARLVADSRRIREQLGWQPRYDDLHQIIADAWRWETR